MKLTISMAQMNVKRSDPEANLKKGEELIAEASRRGSDIICFPEMWTTGFDWEYIDRAAHDSGKVIDHIASLARRYKIWINGSMLAMNEDHKASNSSIMFTSEGKIAGTYRKVHLFSAIGEEKHFAAGNSMCAIDAPWGISALAVCYDIRFPELFRAYAVNGARVVFLPSAFPHPKLEHWRVLTRARAIENQMYVVAVNQAGSEDLAVNGKLTYFGRSVIVDPWGETVAEAGEAGGELITAVIDMNKIDDVRSRMNVLKDRRTELYKKWEGC